MQLRILGPFEVCDDSGQPVKLPAGRERALLAVLAAAARRGGLDGRAGRRPVGRAPPPTAAKALQGYVSHLRRLLRVRRGDGALVTQSPGTPFASATTPSTRPGSRRSRRAAGASWTTIRRALATFEEALALWRGPALGEFAFAEFAQREIHRLDELRLETVEGRIEAHAPARPARRGRRRARGPVDEHPLRERLRGQLMLALYRCGRQAEALEVYRDGRRCSPTSSGSSREPSCSGSSGRSSSRTRARCARGVPARRAATCPSQRRSSAPRGRLVCRRGTCGGRRDRVSPRSGTLLVRDARARLRHRRRRRSWSFDPATNRVVASIPVGSRPATVAAGAGGVWVGDARDGTVTRVDPATRKVVKTIGIGSPVVDLATARAASGRRPVASERSCRSTRRSDAVAQRVPARGARRSVRAQRLSVGVG